MIDDYKHLNRDDKFTVDIDDIAKQIVHKNYGIHRLLSALVAHGKPWRVLHWNNEDNILKDVEKLLNEGKF